MQRVLSPLGAEPWSPNDKDQRYTANLPLRVSSFTSWLRLNPSRIHKFKYYVTKKELGYFQGSGMNFQKMIDFKHSILASHRQRVPGHKSQFHPQKHNIPL